MADHDSYLAAMHAPVTKPLGGGTFFPEQAQDTHTPIWIGVVVGLVCGFAAGAVLFH